MTDKKTYYHSPKETAETMRPMPRPTEPITRGTPEQAATASEYQQKAYKKEMKRLKANVQKFKDADPTRFGK